MDDCIIIKRLRSVYKPHSVHGAEAPLGSHLSGRRVATSLGAAYPGLAFPTRGKGTCEDEPSPIVHRQFRPCLALLPAGVTWPHALLRAPVVSYTTFSPSPLLSDPEGRREWLFVSVARFRQVRAFQRFPAPVAIRRRALWSADFPRSRQRRTATARPT